MQGQKYNGWNFTCLWWCWVNYHEVKAKTLSAIFVRQIGHSTHATEQDLHTAKGWHMSAVSIKKYVARNWWSKSYNKNAGKEEA